MPELYQIAVLQRKFATHVDLLIGNYTTNTWMKAIYPMPKADGTFEEKLEPALQFIASPWKLWESGQITLRRMVLKLAFTDRITYHQS